MAFQTDADGNIYDDGQPSPVQITVTPQSKLPVDYGNSGDTPPWVNLDNSQFDQTAFDAAAARLKRGADHRLKLPVSDDRYNLLPSENPTYMMQPDLQNTQAGDVPLPPGAALNDAGQPYWTATGQPVPVVDRPGILPFARTPEGIKLAMPKLLDLASNIVGGGVAAKVPIKAGEMVLGSGVARTAEEAKYPLATAAERHGNTLNDNLMQYMTPDEFLRKSRPLKIDESSRENIDILKKHIEEGKPLDPLELKQDGKEDGRHRAYAAKELGIKEVPVINFRNEKAEPFYSQLERSVKDARLEKGNAKQWLGYLKNQPGVKFEEINTVLKDLPAGQITKDEMENIVNQNKVKLKEKILGGDSTKERAFELAKEHGWKSWDEIDTAIQNKYLARVSREAGNDKTKYHFYQLPGGENYKEMLLSLPSKGLSKEGLPEGYELINETKAAKNAGFNVPADAPDRWAFRGPGIGSKIYKTREEAIIDAQKHAVTMDNAATFKSSHWDEPNVLANIRMNDRNVEGSKTLHLEEIQSDWHQKGRKEGYKLSDTQKKNLETIDNKLTSGLSEKDIGNPDIDEVLKTAVEQKVVSPEEAKNYKEYSKGENSTVPDAPFKKSWDELALKRVIRHAAENGYEGVSWTPGEAQAARYDLSKQIRNLSFHTDAEGRGTLLGYDHSGNTVLNKEIKYASKELPDIVGKEVAEKLLNQERKDQRGTNRKIQRLENADLKIGGEGMKAFYDKMLVDRANGLIKKYGSKVEGKEIYHGDIGKILKRPQGDGYYISYPTGSSKTFKTAEEALEYNKGKREPIHYFPITPQLKAKALHEGFPLFSSTPILTPVTHNPFDQQQNQNFSIKSLPIPTRVYKKKN